MARYVYKRVKVKGRKRTHGRSKRSYRHHLPPRDSRGRFRHRR